MQKIRAVRYELTGRKLEKERDRELDQKNE